MPTRDPGPTPKAVSTVAGVAEWRMRGKKNLCFVWLGLALAALRNNYLRKTIVLGRSIVESQNMVVPDFVCEDIMEELIQRLQAELEPFIKCVGILYLFQFLLNEYP